MRILNEKDLPLGEKTAVAIGLFDGVHVGHIKLIADICTKKDLLPLIYTFDHKRKITEPILTLEEKCAVFESLGVAECYIQKFDKAFATQTPDDFLQNLRDNYNVRHIAVGFDFRFGYKAQGDVKTLKELGEKFNYTLTVIPQISIDNIKVSSTRIRDLIIEGNLKEASMLMNRFYFMDGIVVSGRHLGHKIGFPTANILPEKQIPPYGVYASIAETEYGRYPAITNIGVKPTVQKSAVPNAETYLIHFDEELYGKCIRIYLVQMLRREMKFNSVEDLRKRIDFDAGCAAEILADLDIYKKYLI